MWIEAIRKEGEGRVIGGTCWYAVRNSLQPLPEEKVTQTF